MHSDPDGLATVEALYAALKAIGDPDRSILDGYHFRYCHPLKIEINKNDLVVTKETTEILNKNDIIVYVLNGQIRIGKIEKVNTDEGNISYIVKANNNYYPETKPIINDQIIGIVILNVFGLGFFLKILQTKIMTIIIFVILIFMFFYNRYIFLKGIERRRKKKKFRPD